MTLPKPVVGQTAPSCASRPIRPLVGSGQYLDVFVFFKICLLVLVRHMLPHCFWRLLGPGTHWQQVIHSSMHVSTSHLTPNVSSVALLCVDHTHTIALLTISNVFSFLAPTQGRIARYGKIRWIRTVSISFTLFKNNESMANIDEDEMLLATGGAIWNLFYFTRQNALEAS